MAFWLEDDDEPSALSWFKMFQSRAETTPTKSEASARERKMDLSMFEKKCVGSLRKSDHKCVCKEGFIGREESG